MLEALRRELPEARVAWVVEAAFAPLLEDHPGIERLIPVRLRGWRKERPSAAVRREIRDAYRALRTFRADVALDLMGNHKGGFLARLSGARRVIGPARPDRREPSSAVWIGEPVAAPGPHVVDRALALLAPLGVEPPAVELGGDHVLTRTPPETADFLAARPGPYAVIQAGAGWGNKSYPPAWWGRVASELRRRAGLEVWVPIAPGEEALAAAVADASGGAARTVDTRPLHALGALIRHARLVLGGDTGPVHLAHAFGTPVLCVVGPTDPRRIGPYGAPERVLHHPLPCSCCYKRFPEPKACLLQIPPERVSARALELLDETAGSASGRPENGASESTGPAPW